MKTVFCFHFVVQEIKSAILCFVRRNEFFTAAHYKKAASGNFYTIYNRWLALHCSADSASD
jgi:hypothetical protein